MGRIVITHSTYIEGLIPKLKKIAAEDDVKSVIPGEIKRSKGKSNSFKLKISAIIRGGYKLIARKGKSLQEVFIITKLEREVLERLVQECEID